MGDGQVTKGEWNATDRRNERNSPQSETAGNSNVSNLE